MFDFIKKYSHTLGQANEQTAEISEKYNAAIKQIEQLECVLHQSSEAQSVLRLGVKNCTATLRSAQEKLRIIAAHLDFSNHYIFELSRENRVLKSSGDEWLNRSIKLEFDVLTIKDKLTKIEKERDLAVNLCEHLQIELMSANKEISRGRN
jgi:F0F1-type ATP synthase membrane subunit b/b'